MAGAQQQQGQGGADSGLAPLWIMALFLIVMVTIWYFWHAYIVAFVFQIKLAEAYMIALFTDSLDRVISLMQHAATQDISLDVMWKASTLVGDYVRYPVIFIILVLAAILYGSDIKRRFRNTYSMKALLDVEHPNWPYITPILKLNLVDQDIDEGPWAMSLPPLGFVKKYNLLRKAIQTEDSAQNGQKSPDVTIKKGEAKRIFSMQLGSYWDSLESLKPHVKALFALCAARINRDRKGSEVLLERIARSTNTGKIDFSGVDELLKKHVSIKEVGRVVGQHAYVFTIMASLLERARGDGVFSSSDFLWLKPVDRELWYILNTIGRQTPFPEVAGIFAHWKAEKALGRKIFVPMVDEAVKGLEMAIKEIKFKGDEF